MILTQGIKNKGSLLLYLKLLALFRQKNAFFLLFCINNFIEKLTVYQGLKSYIKVRIYRPILASLSYSIAFYSFAHKKQNKSHVLEL